MKNIWLYLLYSLLCSELLSIDYQRMKKDAFHERIVGNTVVGVTRQSHSLYMLYFLANGTSQLWKQNQVYNGHWWIDEEEIVHAFWPHYTSSEPKSLFCPKNPSYGKPTSLRYYFDPASGSMQIRGKAFQTSVLLVPGRALPNPEF